MAFTIELLPTVIYILWLLIIVRKNRKRLSIILPIQDQPKIKSVIDLLESVTLFVTATIIWIILNEAIHNKFSGYCTKKAETTGLERSETSDSFWSTWLDNDIFDFEITFGEDEEKVHEYTCDPDFLTWCVTGVGATLLLCTASIEESLLETCYRGATKVSKNVSRRWSKVLRRQLKTEQDSSVLELDDDVVSDENQEEAMIESDEDEPEILQE